MIHEIDYGIVTTRTSKSDVDWDDLIPLCAPHESRGETCSAGFMAKCDCCVTDWKPICAECKVKNRFQCSVCGKRPVRILEWQLL